jgi:hypothetical protein
MRVHADHIGGARLVQADVERVRGPTGRVVEHSDAPIRLRDRGDDLAAAVGRSAVDDEDLELAVELLLADRGQSTLQVSRFVEDGDENGRPHVVVVFPRPRSPPVHTQRARAYIPLRGDVLDPRG